MAVETAASDLVLFAVLTAEQLATCNEAQTWLRTHFMGAPAEGSEEPLQWLTFRATEEAAWDRSNWSVSDPQRYLVKVSFTPLGVGHFTMANALTPVWMHNTWRFHRDLPFDVSDSEGHVLVRTEPLVSIVSAP